MKHESPFTFSNLKSQFVDALRNDYKIITCREYVRIKCNGLNINKLMVNRVDIDFSCKKAKYLAMMFNDLGVKASFFVRLHATEYNPFSFENYLCLKQEALFRLHIPESPVVPASDQPLL